MIIIRPIHFKHSGAIVINECLSIIKSLAKINRDKQYPITEISDTSFHFETAVISRQSNMKLRLYKVKVSENNIF